MNLKKNGSKEGTARTIWDAKLIAAQLKNCGQGNTSCVNEFFKAQEGISASGRFAGIFYHFGHPHQDGLIDEFVKQIRNGETGKRFIALEVLFKAFPILTNQLKIKTANLEKMLNKIATWEPPHFVRNILNSVQFSEVDAESASALVKGAQRYLVRLQTCSKPGVKRDECAIKFLSSISSQNSVRSAGGFAAILFLLGTDEGDNQQTLGLEDFINGLRESTTGTNANEDLSTVELVVLKAMTELERIKSKVSKADIPDLSKMITEIVKWKIPHKDERETVKKMVDAAVKAKSDHTSKEWKDSTEILIENALIVVQLIEKCLKAQSVGEPGVTDNQATKKADPKEYCPRSYVYEKSNKPQSSASRYAAVLLNLSGLGMNKENLEKFIKGVRGKEGQDEQEFAIKVALNAKSKIPILEKTGKDKLTLSELLNGIALYIPNYGELLAVSDSPNQAEDEDTKNLVEEVVRFEKGKVSEAAKAVLTLLEKGGAEKKQSLKTMINLVLSFRSDTKISQGVLEVLKKAKAQIVSEQEKEGETEFKRVIARIVYFPGDAPQNFDRIWDEFGKMVSGNIPPLAASAFGFITKAFGSSPAEPLALKPTQTAIDPQKQRVLSILRELN